MSPGRQPYAVRKWFVWICRPSSRFSLGRDQESLRGRRSTIGPVKSIVAIKFAGTFFRSCPYTLANGVLIQTAGKAFLAKIIRGRRPRQARVPEGPRAGQRESIAGKTAHFVLDAASESTQGEYRRPRAYPPRGWHGSAIGDCQTFSLTTGSTEGDVSR